MTRALLLLVACGDLPPAELGACDYQSPSEYGEVIGAYDPGMLAIACDGWWSCEDGVSYYAGRIYPTSNHADASGSIPDAAVEAAQELRCDRCRWQWEPPIKEDPNARELWGSCDWWM